jgi:hypothetical protein
VLTDQISDAPPAIALLQVRESERGHLGPPQAAAEKDRENRCTRFPVRSGNLRLYNSTLIEDSGEPDSVNWSARELPLEHLPKETLTYLLGSRLLRGRSVVGHGGANVRRISARLATGPSDL